MRSRARSSAPAGTDQPRGLRRWWLNRSLRSKGLIVITIPLVALFATTSASLVLQHSQSQDRAAGVSARSLTTAANLVLADMVNAETGVRGYAAVRDPLFLGPYHLTLGRIDADRNSLREAAAAEGVGRQEHDIAGMGTDAGDDCVLNEIDWIGGAGVLSQLDVGVVGLAGGWIEHDIFKD